MQGLSDGHLAMLRDESGIAEAVIAARGYRTMTSSAELERLGFVRAQCRVPGLLLPLWTTDGGNGLCVYRPDSPRTSDLKTKPKLPDGTYPQRVIKYEQPKGSGMRLDCHPTIRANLGNPAIPLWITEGQKKADALVSRGATAIALLGVWNFKGKNEFEAVTFLADWDYIALSKRQVYVVYDSDIAHKPAVQQALDRLREHLQRKGAVVAVVYLAPLKGGKCGVDDWFVANPDKSLADLEALAQGPKPELKAAPATIELLDAAPLTMARPLALIGGRAYVATWAYVRERKTESEKNGQIVQHDPPIIRHGQRLFVVREDGVIFGEGGQEPLDQLGIHVELPERVRPGQELSTPALKKYVAGYRPKAGDVFHRIAANVDRFMSFDRSLAEQATMCEMAACYCMATWFLDAFTVAGFLWPNGERGSGKTQLLQVITAMAYLGQVVLAGGSFAALRDLADYGATLAFDDAEGLSDPKQTDPDKRTLLLAGNRKGNSVPLKEPDGRRGWKTRYVNTFSFRLFSAIRLPDTILASRTIIIPLIRTPDRNKANADPLDDSLWPHERKALVDDLWLLALSNLPKLRVYEQRVNATSALSGRNLEPWRALLAVAAWLEKEGEVEGVFGRMEQLAQEYQNERPELEASDLTSYVIRGLLVLCARCARCAKCANHNESQPHWVVTTAQVAEEIVELVKADEASLDTEHRLAQRVGMALKRMRWAKPSRPGGKGSRQWVITLSGLTGWAANYGFSLPKGLSEPTEQPVGTVGAVGTVGTAPGFNLLEGAL